MTITDLAVYLAAFLVGSVATGRIVRLWTQDNFPPVAWLRQKFVNLVGPDSTWADLAECPWCASFWFTAVNVSYAWFSELHWSWWFLNVIMAATYVAAWIVVHDED